MEWTRDNMLDIVCTQLAVDMNGSPRDFSDDGVVFREATLNPGRRMFRRQSPFLEIATMGRGIVVSADPPLLPRIRPLLEGRTRDDLFSAPFLYGHSLYYIPDCDSIRPLSCPDGFTLAVREGADIHGLYDHPGFENALQYDTAHPCPDTLALYAMRGGDIAAIAGASADCGSMWQIGIDVLPAYRRRGLAACLVSRLAILIMDRGILPYYGTASSNIPSQSVAHRGGLMPAWMCTYHHIFDGKSPYTGEIDVIINTQR